MAARLLIRPKPCRFRFQAVLRAPRPHTSSFCDFVIISLQFQTRFSLPCLWCSPGTPPTAMLPACFVSTRHLRCLHQIVSSSLSTYSSSSTSSVLLRILLPIHTKLSSPCVLLLSSCSDENSSTIVFFSVRWTFSHPSPIRNNASILNFISR